VFITGAHHGIVRKSKFMIIRNKKGEIVVEDKDGKTRNVTRGQLSEEQNKENAIDDDTLYIGYCSISPKLSIEEQNLKGGPVFFGASVSFPILGKDLKNNIKI